VLCQTPLQDLDFPSIFVAHIEEAKSFLVVDTTLGDLNNKRLVLCKISQAPDRIVPRLGNYLLNIENAVIL
jgi:hypothetical protein